MHCKFRIRSQQLDLNYLMTDGEHARERFLRNVAAHASHSHKLWDLVATDGKDWVVDTMERLVRSMHAIGWSDAQKHSPCRSDHCHYLSVGLLTLPLRTARAASYEAVEHP